MKIFKRSIVGILLLLIAEILINRKIAPFITFAIYFLEYFTKDYLPFLYDLWLPYKDSVQVTGLIMNSTQPADIVSIIIRGIIINIALISLSYYLFLRKDISVMKKSKVVLAAFFIISLFIQIMYFNNSDVFYQYGFAIGIDSSVKQLDIGINLIYVLLPITFIIFLLSGSVERIKSGYGKLLIIRNYSKTKLYLKNFIKNNIDEYGVQLVYKIIKEERNRGALVIVATHHEEDLREMCDTILTVSEGRINEK